MTTDSYDECDIAFDAEQSAILKSLNNIRQAKEIPPSKDCIMCGEPSMPGGKFCGVGCRDDYDHLVKRGIIK